jgi:hypothetical protein
MQLMENFNCCTLASLGVQLAYGIQGGHTVTHISSAILVTIFHGAFPMGNVHGVYLVLAQAQRTHWPTSACDQRHNRNIEPNHR